MTRRVAVLVLVVLVGTVFVGAGVAADGGATGTFARPACSACGGQFETAATDHGLDLRVDHSTATVVVHDDGSATWTVTNHVVNESAVRELRRSPDRLDAIATTAARTPDRLDGSLAWNEGAFQTDATSTTARIDGNGTVTITFTDPSGAFRTPGGTVTVAYLHREADELSPVSDAVVTVNADRITVVGPPGTVVRNDPAGEPTVDGRRISWTGTVNHPNQRYASEQFDGVDDTFVVFGPSGDSPVDWRTTLALGAGNASLLLQQETTLLVGVGALLLLLGVIQAGYHATGARVHRRRVGGWAVGTLLVYGLLTVGTTVVPVGPSPLTTLLVLPFLAVAIAVAMASAVLHPAGRVWGDARRDGG